MKRELLPSALPTVPEVPLGANHPKRSIFYALQKGSPASGFLQRASLLFRVTHYASRVTVFPTARIVPLAKRIVNTPTVSV